MWNPFKKKSADELATELQSIRKKRISEEGVAKLKTKLQEEKTRVREAKYGSFSRGLKSIGKELGAAAQRARANQEKQYGNVQQKMNPYDAYDPFKNKKKKKNMIGY